MKNPGSKIHAFLKRLESEKIPYRLDHVRDNAIMVEVSAPGEHWEIEFFEDGSVEAERCRPDGKMRDESVLDELFARLTAEASD